MDGKSGCVWPFVAVCGSVSLAMDGTSDGDGSDGGGGSGDSSVGSVGGGGCEGGGGGISDSDIFSITFFE